ncbi:uncharacterized protein [Magallana gigas]|uniref:uncharacterized protein n=1 Tax=Magallana gigas TaxID=29159 RepID=UPI0033426A45|eukprot:GAHX01003746.1.p2 GENE.GAHX01003746.1~~GAHX01003746.1.p2  ORF type:complete len:82 (-),score=10.04 GAHX01003746.1:196-441(-)
MKLAGALLVMGILVVLTGANDGSTTTLEDAGEESSTAAGDTGTTPTPEPETTTTDNSAGKMFPLSVAFILILPFVLALGGL